MFHYILHLRHDHFKLGLICSKLRTSLDLVWKKLIWPLLGVEDVCGLGLGNLVITRLTGARLRLAKFCHQKNPKNATYQSTSFETLATGICVSLSIPGSLQRLSPPQCHRPRQLSSIHNSSLVFFLTAYSSNKKVFGVSAPKTNLWIATRVNFNLSNIGWEAGGSTSIWIMSLNILCFFWTYYICCLDKCHHDSWNLF